MQLGLAEMSLITCAQGERGHCFELPPIVD